MTNDRRVARDKWEWFGYPGHFIAANSCRFRLCTKVGKYLISTVGDYEYNGKRQTLGSGDDSFFETYVFNAGPRCADAKCGCGQPTLASASEIDGTRTGTAGEAQKAHLKYCAKYSRKQAATMTALREV